MGTRIEQRRIRRTKRCRIARLSLIGALVMLTAIAPLAASSNQDNHPTVRITVYPGDTLWELARAHGPSSEDPRRTVGRIGKINDLTGSLIRPGDVLLIPTT